jgi:hypothetical protein
LTSAIKHEKRTLDVHAGEIECLLKTSQEYLDVIIRAIVNQDDALIQSEKSRLHYLIHILQRVIYHLKASL